MQNLNLKVGGRTRVDNLNKPTGSFLPSNLDALKEVAIKRDIRTKIVNTNVSKEVFQAFMFHCIKKDKSHKNMFPVMLNYLFDKWKEEVIDLQTMLGEKSIDFSNKINANFEYDITLVNDVKEFKVRNLIKFNTLYEQAIIQYLNDHM